MFTKGEEVWFHDKSGTYKGYVEKNNKHTINVLVDDNRRPEGYQLWRVTEFFLSKTPEEAVEKWEVYQIKLREVKNILEYRRKYNGFSRGNDILIQPYEKEPYMGTILSVDRITLIVRTEDNKFMRVDKAICMPTQYY